MIHPKKFRPNEHAITLAEGSAFVSNFKTHFSPDGFIAKPAVLALIQQQNAVGLRYYYAIDDIENTTKLLFVGVDEDRNDLIRGEAVKVSIPAPPLNAKDHFDVSRVDHTISKESATRFAANYRKQKSKDQPHGGFFSYSALLMMLSRPGCVGIAFYFGATKKGIRNIVMMGIDQHCQEMADEWLLEFSSLCPPWCGDGNYLNGFIAKDVQKRTFKYIEPNQSSGIAA